MCVMCDIMQCYRLKCHRCHKLDEFVGHGHGQPVDDACGVNPPEKNMTSQNIMPFFPLKF